MLNPVPEIPGLKILDPAGACLQSLQNDIQPKACHPHPPPPYWQNTYFFPFFDGFPKNESLMNSSFWVEDVTHPFFGRYFTLNLGKRITPNYADDQIFLHLQRRTNFTIFIYHSNFFLLNSNILSFPMIIKDVSSSMGNHYWNLAMTERFELNHPNDPCYEGKFWSFSSL